MRKYNELNHRDRAQININSNENITQWLCFWLPTFVFGFNRLWKSETNVIFPLLSFDKIIITVDFRSLFKARFPSLF
jgi:hypothetical protein